MASSIGDEELREWAAEHLAYEIWMLRSLIDRIGGLAIQTADGSPGPDQVLVNAVIESFGFHARALTEFLWGSRRQADDAVASDYVDDWEEVRPTMPEVLSDVRPRVGKEIAHLTYHRLTVVEDSKRWKNGEIWMAIRDALVVLVKTAPEERFPTAIKAKVRAYLV